MDPSGTVAIAAINRVSDGSVLWTTLVAIPVVVWWLLFLVLVSAQVYRS